MKEKTQNYNFDVRLHVGFSAQEIEKTFPHLVSSYENGYLALNYTELIPILIKALQAQNAKIVELEKAVYELKK